MAAVAARIGARRPGYFAQIPEALLDAPGVTLAEFRVYGWLDRRAGARGWWHDSARALAREIGISDRSVRRALEALEARGLLVVERRSHLEACYMLPERLAESAPRCADHGLRGRGAGAAPGAPSAAPTPHQRGADAALLRHPRRTGASYTSIRSEEPSGEPIQRAQQLMFRDGDGAIARLVAIASREAGGDRRQGRGVAMAAVRVVPEPRHREGCIYDPDGGGWRCVAGCPVVLAQRLLL